MYSLYGSYDVIVCGGGTSGVAAALQSARSGAKTLLIERVGQLGGQMNFPDLRDSPTHTFSTRAMSR